MALLCYAIIQAQEESIEAQALLDSAYSHSRYIYDTCIQFVDSALQIKGYNKEEYYSHLSHFYLGICNHRHEHYDEALREFDEGITAFETLKDTAVLADLYYYKSLVYRHRADYKEFLLCVNKSLELAAAIDYRENIAMGNNVKLIYFDERKRYAQAEECGLKALALFEALGDSSSLGDIYNNLGAHMSAQNRYDEALHYHLLQHEVNIKLDNTWGKGFSFSKLAMIYAKQGKYSLAQSHMNESLAIRREIGTAYALSGALTKSAKVKNMIGDQDGAMRDIHESILISRKLNIPKAYASGLAQLAEIHKSQSALDSALFYTELLMATKDSMMNLSLGQQLDELEIRYETEKRDKEILQLQYEDELNQAKIDRKNIIILSGLIGLGMLAFLFFRVRSKKQKIAEQNTLISTSLEEKEMLLKEIHHRVKNNLQIVSSLLSIQSRTIKDEKAKEAIKESRSRVRSMSLLHQDLYQKDNLAGVLVADYLPKLCKSLLSAYDVSGEHIQLTTDIEPINLDIETVIPLGLIVNELITNVLKYAFPDGKEGTVLVQLKETAEGLLLSVQDDGIGFPKERAKNTQGGFGHKLISTFKNKLQADIRFINNNGARVELLIKAYQKV